jgi:hypothetical protein
VFDLDALLDFLLLNYPSVITFGYPEEKHFSPNIIPNELRPDAIDKLMTAIKNVLGSKIDKHQKNNVIHAIRSIINALKTADWDKDNLRKWQQFVNKMDTVKNINAKDYSNFLTKLLEYQIN